MQRWIAQLFKNPDLLKMGHCQSSADLNLGMGWLYYGFARMLRPKKVVVIGSWRGFVPLVLGKALADNQDVGAAASLLFIDPSLVDDFWKEPERVRKYFADFGLNNVEHVLLTTQDFCRTDRYRTQKQVDLLFIDGYHTEEQARFDFRAFESLIPPNGIVMLHDSCAVGPSTMYGRKRRYVRTVKAFVNTLKCNPAWQVLDLPLDTGLTIVRKTQGSEISAIADLAGAAPTIHVPGTTEV